MILGRTAIMFAASMPCTTTVLGSLQRHLPQTMLRIVDVIEQSNFNCGVNSSLAVIIRELPIIAHTLCRLPDRWCNIFFNTLSFVRSPYFVMSTFAHWKN